MVLPVRIELTTSPLPRGCSTTELRQRAKGPSGGAPDIHEAPAIDKQGGPIQGGGPTNIDRRDERLFAER